MLFNRKMYRQTFTAVTLCMAITGCSGKLNHEQAALEPSKELANPSLAEVTGLTAEHEHMIDDGWYFGQYPRIFKSPYAGASAQLKAKFASDYAQMLREKNQDLVANWDSYVPYTTRAQFADAWWTANDDSGRFAQTDRKMHVVWRHEAMLDAGELWWRAYEAKNTDKVPTAMALAHDEEQKKVFNYMDREGQPRSLSDLVAAAKEKAQ